MYIVLFPVAMVAAPDYFLPVGMGPGGGLWGGVRGQKYKKPKWLIFAIFVLVSGGMWGQGLRLGKGQMPHAPMSPETPNTT